ncbi:AAA+ family ATPase [filamentous cyanobacterium CCP5]|nr:AAA+ family ATPase [filamentous cyanobacterium CCP5]
MSGLASQVVSSVLRWRQQMSTLLVYDQVFHDPVGNAYVELLEALCSGQDTRCLAAYSRWFKALAGGHQSWANHLIERILQDENPFSLQAQSRHLFDLSEPLMTAVRRDLRVLQQFYSLSPTAISQWLQTVCQLPEAPIPWSLPVTAVSQVSFPTLPDWGEGLSELAAYYRRWGTGLLSRYRAYRWQGELLGIAYPDRIQLSDLAAYDQPRRTLIQNTEHFLAGHRALHTLLYGSRGSGKSSLVKALVNHYGDRGLRLVEVAKADLRDLPKIVDRLRAAPQRFIIFVDDLSFEDDDEAFKALKVVLEGSVTARPDNVVVYATSNRRHLVREYFADRPRPKDQDEIQAWDTLQEKLSFSDRFGLTLTFEPADQPTYLAIVQHLAAQAGISLPEEVLSQRALQWATRHNGRSGRTARQFIDFLAAEQAS